MNQPVPARSLPRLPVTRGGTTAERVGAKIRARNAGTRIAFLVIVIIPTVLTAIYTGLLATPRYVSEAQFVVRGLSTSSSQSGLQALLRTFGMSRTVDDANVVQSYILSRDAMKALEARVPLRSMFQRSDVDRLARFPRPWEWDSDERFYNYYLDRVSLIQDSAKGISTLKVVAFSAQDAFTIASQLLTFAEELANRMNLRALNDSVGYAETRVTEAERDVINAQLALTDFRNKNLVVDPSKASDLQLDTITSLSLDYSRVLAAIKETSISAGSSPAIASLRAKADALQERIDAERSKLAGSDRALAGRVSEYEKLILERDLAGKALTAATDALQVARQDARRQLIYVEQIVAPGLADESTEPGVLRYTATAFVLGFAIFAFLWIISVGAQEHEQ